MVTWLKDYLHRIGHIKGYGIQSPWAYNLVREVIAERLPYYAYEQIDTDQRLTNEWQRKLVRLYFRLANRLQPQSIVGSYSDLERLGCRKAQSIVVSQGFTYQDTPLPLPTPLSLKVIVHLPLHECTDKKLSTLLPHITPDSLIIVEGITLSEQDQKRWHAIRDDARIGITFDLRHPLHREGLALCFLDLSKHKQHYHLNI